VVEVGEALEDVEEPWTIPGRYAAPTSVTAMTATMITTLGIKPIVW